MGQTLSEPVVEKHGEEGGDNRLVYALSNMQGWRISMEDAHSAVLQLSDTEKGKLSSFFAVFDGHGGSNVAKYSGQHVHERLSNDADFKEQKYTASLKNSFLGTDVDLRANPDFADEPSGCTAVAALFTPDNKILVANAGDSRSVLSSNGEAIPMSFDHKPVNKDESARIVAAGGFVEFGRVNGNLALSRAIGDFEFKQNSSLSAEEQIVTADPEIVERTIEETDEFLVLACDGIWDCLTSQQVIDFVRREIWKKTDLQKICEDIMDKCLAPESDFGGVGCDNMTMMIVGILHGKTKEEWYDWVADRVEKETGYPTPKDDDVEIFTARDHSGGNSPEGISNVIIPNTGFMMQRVQDEHEHEHDDEDHHEEEITFGGPKEDDGTGTAEASKVPEPMDASEDPLKSASKATS